MSTSDIDAGYKKNIKSALKYLVFTLFILLFGIIYEAFSHEVYSFFMIYAFLFPLLGGVLPYTVSALSKKSYLRQGLMSAVYAAGIIALTVGSLMNGVLEIYGTTNALVIVYWIAGGGLIATALIYGLSKRAAVDTGI